MAGIVENFRRTVIEGTAPDLQSLFYSAASSAVLLPAAFLIFKNREATMADLI
jgi:ABC-type polysaccharide/polyol phosphate export permease